MTPSELFAIRERLDAAPRATLRTSLFGRLTDDARALLDEVERLTTLLAGTEAVLENEREYQTRLKAEVGQLANESFRRGAEAMKQAAVLVSRENVGCRHTVCHSCVSPASAIRFLPMPEDES